MEHALWLDTLSSILAFLGLGSLVVCYVDYKLRWFDYVIFVVLFFVFGWYAGLAPNVTTAYQYLTAISFAVGVVFLLWLKSLFLAKKAKHNSRFDNKQ